MLTELDWLALEVKYLERARTFYGEYLGLGVRGANNTNKLVFNAGDTDLICRRPTDIPRGGLHTHFAFSIPAAEYDDWWDHLESDCGFPLEEVTFGNARSLYLYDPDGNCVELGETRVDGPGIDGIFEVVLEVADLERARSLYELLGFEPVDVGENRTRIRLQGPMALELWEPHLGLADARGGVHVDLGFKTDDLEGVVSVVEGTACSCSLERIDGGAVRVRDADGHFLTFQRES